MQQVLDGVRQGIAPGLLIAMVIVVAALLIMVAIDRIRDRHGKRDGR